MKPNWKDAPEWANYLAMDYDGEWYWYEVEPCESGNYWANEDKGRCVAADVGDYWKETLESRPE